MKLHRAISNYSHRRREQDVLVPLVNLSVSVVVGVGAERVRVDETTEGVTTEISTVGVKLSSTIARLDVDLRLVDEADDLDVARGLGELHAGKGASGDQARAVTLLGAPSDLLTLRVTNGGVGLHGRPQAEVCGPQFNSITSTRNGLDKLTIKMVDDRRLAERLGTLSGGVTPVVTALAATDEVVGVGLVGL